jgi:hypothetical protein
MGVMTTDPEEARQELAAAQQALVAAQARRDRALENVLTLDNATVAARVLNLTPQAVRSWRQRRQE